MQGWFGVKLGLDLGKRQDVTKGGILICFIKIMYSKVIRDQFFIVWNVGFSVGWFGRKVGTILGEIRVGSRQKKTVTVWASVKFNSGDLCSGKSVGLRRDLSR